MRAWKNPRVNDAQRNRLQARRIIEERSVTESIWDTTQARTDNQKIVDYVHFRQYEKERRLIEKQGKRGYRFVDRNIGIRQEDHITTRIVAGVLWPNGYNRGRFPTTDQEKYLDNLGCRAVHRHVCEIRLDPRYRYVAILTDMLHEDPDTKDLDNVIFEGRTEKKKRGLETIEQLAMNDPRRMWMERRNRIEGTYNERTEQTTDNSLRDEKENIILEREDLDNRDNRGRRRRRGS